MPIISIAVSDQELATLEAAARLRGVDVSGGWAPFYAPWHSDAYGQVQRTIGSRVADDPALAAQMLGLLTLAAPETPAGE